MPELHTRAAKYRFASVMTFLDGWSAACTTAKCLSAAKAVGVYPFNSDAPKQSPFFRNLTPEEAARQQERARRNANGLDIGLQELTDATFLARMCCEVAKNVKYSHLCNLEFVMTMSYKQLIQHLLAHPKNDSFLLSLLPPLIIKNQPPILFR